MTWKLSKNIQYFMFLKFDTLMEQQNSLKFWYLNIFESRADLDYLKKIKNKIFDK